MGTFSSEEVCKLEIQYLADPTFDHFKLWKDAQLMYKQTVLTTAEHERFVTQCQ